MFFSPYVPIWMIVVISILILVFKRKGIFGFIRQIIIVALLDCILMGPFIPGEAAKPEEKNVNLKVLFVIDNTLSMLAEDYQGENPRFDAVARDCAHIIDELEGASFSVISFSNAASTRCPYISDVDYVVDLITSLRPGENFYSIGTSFDRPILLMEKSLESARQKIKDSGEAGKVVVFYITDGEITNKSEQASYQELKKKIDAGAVLGYGTEEGGKMHYIDSYGRSNLVLGSDGKAGISKIDEENMKQIAKEMGIDYVHMTKQKDIDKTLEKILEDAEEELLELEMDEEGANPLDNAVSVAYYFALPLLGLLILECALLIRKR